MTATGAGRIRDSIERSWRPFRDLAGELGTARLEERTTAGWSAKEMLGTVAFWDEAAFGWITIGLRGQELAPGWKFGSGYEHETAWPSADVHNSREAAWARSRTVPQVLDRCDEAHAQLLALVANVTDEEAAKHGNYFSQLGGHYDDHLPELQALDAHRRPAV